MNIWTIVTMVEADIPYELIIRPMTLIIQITDVTPKHSPEYQKDTN